MLDKVRTAKATLSAKAAEEALTAEEAAEEAGAEAADLRAAREAAAAEDFAAKMAEEAAYESRGGELVDVQSELGSEVTQYGKKGKGGCAFACLMMNSGGKKYADKHCAGYKKECPLYTCDTCP